jgi:hypothetical protein
MPKDYKDAPAPRAESRLNHPLLLGMIIGLLLGIVISLAVALWLNRLSNPFVEKGKQVEPISKIAPPQSQPPAEAAKAAEVAARARPPRPRNPGQGCEKPAPGEARRLGSDPALQFYQIPERRKARTRTRSRFQDAAPASAAAIGGRCRLQPVDAQGVLKR